jgi:hypothetical protein
MLWDGMICAIRLIVAVRSSSGARAVEAVRLALLGDRPPGG